MSAQGSNVKLLDVGPEFQQALQEIRSAKFREAIQTSATLEKAFPEHPLAALIQAEAYWGMMYYQTGHITSSEIWNEADEKTSPNDRDFQQAIEKSIELGEQMRKRPESAAAAVLYIGYAHGARARLYALRDQGLKSASDAKQMRGDLLEAVKLNPDLESDAGLGLGTYNYYADVLSPILKFFRFFAGIPGGNRDEGLQQLRNASERAVLWNEEARYELARIYAVREGRHADALSLFKDLSARFPDNPLYALFTCYEEEKVSGGAAAMQYCQKAKAAAEKLDPAYRGRIQNAAQGAVERLQAQKTVVKPR
jgi:hypothetical protein